MADNKTCICDKCIDKKYCASSGTKKDWCACFMPTSISGTVHTDIHGNEVFEPFPKDEKYMKRSR